MAGRQLQVRLFGMGIGGIGGLAGQSRRQLFTWSNGFKGQFANLVFLAVWCTIFSVVEIFAVCDACWFVPVVGETVKFALCLTRTTRETGLGGALVFLLRFLVLPENQT
jgi:hypothetical protein